MSSSVSNDAIGLVVADRYRLVALVGTGPSAVVYLADDVRLRRRVAVKMLDAAFGADDAFLERFQVEMHAAAQLRHPHIGAVHDWGTDRVPFVVGDHFDHGSLRDLIDRGVLFSPSQLMQLALAGGRALAHAHSRGIVHRDVRPENLLFGADGRVELVDFGLARARADAAATRPLELHSAIDHVAPEQLTGGTVDGRADVFALVTVLVEAATGRPAVRAVDVEGTGVEDVSAPAIPARVGAMRDVLARASVTDPAQRLDAAAFVTALMAVADSYPEPGALPLRRSGPVVPPPPDVGDDITIVGVPGMLVPSTPAGVVPAEPTPITAPPPQAPPATPPAHSRDGEEVSGTVSESAEGRSAPEPERAEPASADTGGQADDSKGSGRRVAWILLVALVVVGGGVVGWFVYQAQRTPTHLVPAVETLDTASAQERLSALGFRVRTRTVRLDDTKAGELVEVRPTPGTRLAEGRTVTLTVSQGPPLVGIPDDLGGRSVQDATGRLGKLGLEVSSTVERHSENVPEGSVIDTEPAAGENLEKGAGVVLVVSKGPRPRVIPSLEGMGADGIETTLRDLGLVPAVSERYDTDVDTGGLIGVDPPVGSSVPRGTEVRVVISKGLLVAVPDLGGVTTVTGAMERLTDSGLVANGLLGSGSLSGRPEAFDPPSGELVVKGSSVDIVVR